MSNNKQNWRLKAKVQLFLIVVWVFVVQASVVKAANSEGWNNALPATYSYWVNQLNMPTGGIPDRIDIDVSFSTNEERIEIIDFGMLAVGSIGSLISQGTVNGITISGTVSLNSDASLVRVLLIDTENKEHLLYEAYPLMLTEMTYDINGVCEETCIQNNFTPKSLIVELIDAEIDIENAEILSSPVGTLGQSIEKIRPFIRDIQNRTKLQAIRNKIIEKGMQWKAGPTPLSTLPFARKRNMLSGLPGDQVRHLNGLEFYQGGIFEFPAQSTTLASDPGVQPVLSALTLTPPPAFDWRNRHGANTPTSPYFDGDLNRDGWLTQVKDQSNTMACWAYSAIGATEAASNLYFNDHLNLDLSEQDICSSSGGGSCRPADDGGRGGFVSDALRFIENTGVIDESCFPFSYLDADQSSGNKCIDPNEQISISGRSGDSLTISSEDDLKWLLIENGPMTVARAGHAMVLVGYYPDPRDGNTVWIYKNSSGGGWVGWRYPWVIPDLDTLSSWGIRGYLHEKLPFRSFWLRHTFAITSPIVSMINNKEIACHDMDGDGYYYWGLGTIKPLTCPANAPDEKDCDDASAHLGPHIDTGRCSVLDYGPHKLITLAGDKDNNDSGDEADKPLQSLRIVEMLSFSENIAKIVGQKTSVALDEGGTDRSVGYTHYFYLPANALITSANVKIRLTGSGHFSNDAIYYDDSASISEQRLLPPDFEECARNRVDPWNCPPSPLDCATVPPGNSCNPQLFYPLITLRDVLGEVPVNGKIYDINIDFAKVPVRTSSNPGPGNQWDTQVDEYRNIFDTLYDNEFNIIVSDDSKIDYSELSITYVLPKSEKPGDLTGDARIDRSDFSVFRAALGKCRGVGGYTELADYDADGCITYVDYRAWYGFYRSQ